MPIERHFSARTLAGLLDYDVDTISRAATHGELRSVRPAGANVRRFRRAR